MPRRPARPRIFPQKGEKKWGFQNAHACPPQQKLGEFAANSKGAVPAVFPKKKATGATDLQLLPRCRRNARAAQAKARKVEGVPGTLISDAQLALLVWRTPAISRGVSDGRF